MSTTATSLLGIVVDLVQRIRPGESREIIAASESGLHWSIDEGVSWLASSAFTDTPVTAIGLVSPLENQDGPLLLASGPGYVARSTSADGSWSRVMLPSPAPVVTALASLSGDCGGSVAIACTLEDGVFRSTDGGCTWQASSIGLVDMSVSAISTGQAHGYDRLIVLGVKSGVFRSTNGGRSWHELELPQDDQAAITAVSIICTGNAAALVVAGSETGELYRSLDAGENWYQAEHHYQLGEVIEIFESKVSNTETVILAAFSLGVLESADWGLTWSLLECQPSIDQERQLITATLLGANTSQHQMLVGVSDGAVQKLIVRRLRHS